MRNRALEAEQIARRERDKAESERNMCEQPNSEPKLTSIWSTSHSHETSGNQITWHAPGDTFIVP